MRVVLIHDQPDLRQLLADLLQNWKKHPIEVESAGYDLRFPSVWQRWMVEADLFILGLERWYELGMRAEGVEVAERLSRFGKRVLLVGSEAVGSELPCTVYWDLASSASFLETVDQVLCAAPVTPSDLAQLKEHFGDRLSIPTGH